MVNSSDVATYAVECEGGPKRHRCVTTTGTVSARTEEAEGRDWNH